MARSNRGVNIVFGITVALLAAVAAVSMFLNKDLPPVLDAPGSAAAAGSGLPEGHPPVNAASQITALEQMSRNNPESADIKIQLGNAYYDAGQFQKAAGAYEESLKMQPSNPGVETDLATCYHEMGQSDKALTLLDKVLGYQPGFAQALYNKGIVLQAGKKDIKGAIAAWEGLLKANPGFPQRAEIEQKLSQMRTAAQ
jgi:cytochrome c-type biogenesis protein CcmH/NrfG